MDIDLIQLLELLDWTHPTGEDNTFTGRYSNTLATGEDIND